MNIKFEKDKFNFNVISSCIIKNEEYNEIIHNVNYDLAESNQ